MKYGIVIYKNYRKTENICHRWSLKCVFNWVILKKKLIAISLISEDASWFKGDRDGQSFLISFTKKSFEDFRVFHSAL